MDKLPRHLAAMANVLACCAEVIHCDSYSDDGTKAFVSKELSHPCLKQVDHPPGLYASWNHAIQQCTQKYIYISTIGDTITEDGLRRLLTLAEDTKADIVISPPRFVAAGGEEGSLDWPIHKIVREYRLASPRALPAALMFSEAIFNCPNAVIGSSASNLYRASFLQPRPFPVDYHGAGDAAWAIHHAAEARWAIFPEVVSTFLIHPKSYEVNVHLSAEIAARMTRHFKQIIDDMHNRPSGLVAGDPLLKRVLAHPALAEMELLNIRETAEQAQLESVRKRTRYWYFVPRAWGMRFRRNGYRRLKKERIQDLRTSLRIALESERKLSRISNGSNRETQPSLPSAPLVPENTTG